MGSILSIGFCTKRADVKASKTSKPDDKEIKDIVDVGQEEIVPINYGYSVRKAQLGDYTYKDSSDYKKYNFDDFHAQFRKANEKYYECYFTNLMKNNLDSPAEEYLAEVKRLDKIAETHPVLKNDVKRYHHIEKVLLFNILGGRELKELTMEEISKFMIYLNEINI